MASIVNAAAYQFVRLDNLVEWRGKLRTICDSLGLKGTILISREGINLFVAGEEPQVREFFSALGQWVDCTGLQVKYSPGDHQPFTRMLVRIKREIIAFGQSGINPIDAPTPRIAARQLKSWLDEERDLVLLDVRNDYEVSVGTFRNARSLAIGNFRQFPEAAQGLPDELRRKTIVTFCTGGIRCEKAGPFLQQIGFQDVYQLDGGILKYFEEIGQEHFQGRCFVFDKRVAVDASLAQADLALCFECQAVLSPADQRSEHYRPGSHCPHCWVAPEVKKRLTLEQRHAAIASATNPLPGSVPYENRRPLNVSRRFDGLTLWDFLTTLHPQVDGSVWRQSINAGQIRCRGRSLSADECVRDGQRIEHVLPGSVEPPVAANIRILYEDEALIIVDKPAPLPVHPSGRFNRNTLTYILDQAYAPLFPRPQHRLDANTSGIVVLTKTKRWANALRRQFEARAVKKSYLCAIEGVPQEDELTLEYTISRHPQEAGKRIVSSDGRSSRTRIQVLRRLSAKRSLLLVSPQSGRTNQIRVHLSQSGWPVVGDPLYGKIEKHLPHTLRPGDPPMCLHHWRIGFRHPVDQRPVTFETEWPRWLRELMPPDAVAESFGQVHADD